MNNPFLQTIQSRLFYVNIWIIIILIQVFLVCNAFHPTLSESYYYGFDALICNTLQAICILASWYPVRYYRNVPGVFLFVLFHLFLLLFSFAIWLGFGFLLTDLVLPEEFAYQAFFMRILPVRIFFGLLIYVIFILVYYLFPAKAEIEAQKAEIEAEESTSKSSTKEKIKLISVKKLNEIYSIPVEQIFYIEANGDYVQIYTVDNKFLKDRTMKYLETHLPEELFVRIHRSFIVNVAYISKIELYEKEIYKVHLKNGSRLKASSAGYKLLRQKIMKTCPR
jgi:hypothetical protein